MYLQVPVPRQSVVIYRKVVYRRRLHYKKYSGTLRRHNRPVDAAGSSPAARRAMLSSMLNAFVKSVLKMLIDFDSNTGTMRETQEELAELRHEVERLQGIEEEAKSLRNATTAMGMALESEQEARNEIERELQIEKRERHMTEEELDNHKKSIQTKLL